MKRIMSKEKEEKRKKRNQTIFGIFLIVVLITGIVGFPFFYNSPSSAEVKVEYDGTEFTHRSGYWVTPFGERLLVFRNNPYETTNSSEDIRGLANYYNKPLYLYSDDSRASEEIRTNLGPYVQRIESACFGGENCSRGEVRGCEENFIIIKESKANQIFQSNKCVFIRSSEDKLVEKTDEFLFRLFEIK